MLLPFREHLDFGPTPYDQLQAKDGIPVVRGNVVSDVLELELGRWERMGVAGCYLNLAEQQQTDAYVCEIPSGRQTLPQRHLYEAIVYLTSGRGATSVWQEGKSKVTFEWGAGAVFAIPLNSSYQHFNGSRDEPVRLFAGTTCPRMINIFHNEDFIFRNPFNFRDRFHDGQEDRKSTRLNSSHLGISYAVFCLYRHLRGLPSFPTRRSSDLGSRRRVCHPVEFFLSALQWLPG